jgi:DNA polymerase zeta
MHVLRCPHAAQLSTLKEGQEDEYGFLNASGLHVAGRIVLNTWRLMRSGAS